MKPKASMSAESTGDEGTALTDAQVDALMDAIPHAANVIPGRQDWDRNIFRAGMRHAADIALGEQLWAGRYTDANPDAFAIADEARLRIFEAVRRAARRPK